MIKWPKTPVTIATSGGIMYGWLNSSVDRSMEQIGGRFDIRVSFLADFKRPPIERQDKVVIAIGGVPVITGICLGAEPFYATHEDYGIRVEGHSRTGDLMLASAIHKGGQWRNVKLEQIVKDLCKPFDIKVICDIDTGKKIGRFKLNNGESVAEAISRACKYRAVLPTDDAAGNMVLTRVGEEKALAAIVAGPGGNVIEMEGIGNDSERAQEYIVQGQGEVNETGDPHRARGLEYRAKDPGIKRYLPLIVNADESSDTKHLQELADHTARTRAAKSMRYKYTVEGWEANGKPWHPNTLVPVYDPVLGSLGQEWLIVKTLATVSRDNADVTEIEICPPAAFEQLPLPEAKQSGKGKSGSAWYVNHQGGG